MQKRAVKTRNQILNSAIKLFAKQGFAGTSIDQISKHAKANKERIYAYYGSKGNLFEQCLVRVFEKASLLEDDLLSISQEQISQMTKKILTAYLTVHEKHPELHRLLLWGNLNEKNLMKALKGIKSTQLEHLHKLYLIGQTSGIFKEDVSFDVYMFNLTAISFFYYSNCRTISNTMVPGVYSADGRERLINETVSLLS